MTNANLSSWIDRTAFDPDGEEVGVIDDVSVDDATWSMTPPVSPNGSPSRRAAAATA